VIGFSTLGVGYVCVCVVVGRRSFVFVCGGGCMYLTRYAQHRISMKKGHAESGLRLPHTCRRASQGGGRERTSNHALESFCSSLS
jgi:hypothetical protein